jgi:hypothetical protein
MNARRNIFAALAVSALGLGSGHVLAAPPVVEILAMPHPPVKVALAPLREWLAAQGSKFKLVETDIESAQGEKRVAAAGLGGHIPIVILIDGQYRHKGKDGVALEFVNFPAMEGVPVGARGKWTTADVQAVLADKLKSR